MKPIIESIIFSILGEPSEACSLPLGLRNLGISPLYPYQLHLLPGHSYAPTYLIFFLPHSTYYLPTSHKMCLFIMVADPPCPPPVVSECHEGRDFCVLFTNELPMSTTVLSTEGRCNTCLLNGQFLGLPFIAHLCAYPLIWWSSCFSNFLRKGACGIHTHTHTHTHIFWSCHVACGILVP